MMVGAQVKPLSGLRDGEAYDISRLFVFFFSTATLSPSNHPHPLGSKCDFRVDR